MCQNGLHILYSRCSWWGIMSMGSSDCSAIWLWLPGNPHHDWPLAHSFSLSNQCRSEHRRRYRSTHCFGGKYRFQYVRGCMAPRQASSSSCCVSCMASARRWSDPEFFESWCSKATPWTPVSDWLMVSNVFLLYDYVYIYIIIYIYTNTMVFIYIYICVMSYYVL